MNHIFPECMLDVVFLGLTVPLRIELMYLYPDFLELLNIECFVHLTKATPA